MGIYFPQFDEVHVFRNAVNPEQYVTLVMRGHSSVENVVIDGEEYVLDEHGTERTRMYMRVNAQRREEAKADG